MGRPRTGDRGRRLHWIYWLPGETVADLEGRFAVRTVADRDGVDYTFDASGAAIALATNPDAAQPTSWVNDDADGDGVADGVIGTFGNAWWASEPRAAALERCEPVQRDG